VVEINFMEVEMKSMTKIICCGVALAWMGSAVARGDVANVNQAAEVELSAINSAADGVEVSTLQTSGAAPVLADATTAIPADAAVPVPVAAEDAKAVPTPPAPRITVKPYHDKINRANVEKRIENNAAITQKRSAVVEKDAADRAAKAQQGQ
jgi:hypothetical protein